MPPLNGTDQDSTADTVELELSPAEHRQLSRMYEAAMRVSAASPAYDRFICERAQRADALGTTTFAAIVCAIGGLVGRHVLDRGSAPQISSVATPMPAATAPQTALPAPQQVANPFDPTEVFELPAGMDESAARNAIAEVLLERARERVARGLDRSRRRTGTRSHPVVAPKPSDVFVTSIVPAASGLAGSAGRVTTLLE